MQLSPNYCVNLQGLKKYKVDFQGLNNQGQPRLNCIARIDLQWLSRVAKVDRIARAEFQALN